MNKEKLKIAEREFLNKYPKGFNDPEMVAIGKKHKMDKMVEMAQVCFAKTEFNKVDTTLDNMVKTISRSSMVSMFEKPKFRDFAKSLTPQEKEFIVESLYEQLHGKQQLGFERMVDILKTGKLAKWSLISIIPAYYAPTKEVFVKPTTAKNVIAHFEVGTLFYKPTPTWDFYQGYKKLINQMKTKVNKGLSPSNAAFSGFLMMSV